MQAMREANPVSGLPLATHGNPVIWLVTASWTGVNGMISILSVGIIILIATVFLLAVFGRANA